MHWLLRIAVQSLEVPIRFISFRRAAGTDINGSHVDRGRCRTASVRHRERNDPVRARRERHAAGHNADAMIDGSPMATRDTFDDVVTQISGKGMERNGWECSTNAAQVSPAGAQLQI